MGEVCIFSPVSIVASSAEWTARLGESSSVLLIRSSSRVLLVPSPSPSELGWRESIEENAVSKVEAGYEGAWWFEDEDG